MEWKNALNKFLEQYKNEEWFLGAILTGSYATGNNNDNSDIDLYIVTTDETQWRERGNKLVDGYLIEYFMNPVHKILSYFEEETKMYAMSTIGMFVNGKILIDKNGIVEKISSIAKEKINSSLEPVDEFKVKMNCYHVWDGFDELDSKYKNNEDIDYVYYMFLQKIIDSYFYNKQIPLMSHSKIEKILTNEEYRNKYNIKKLPDPTFCNLLINCFKEKDYDRKYECAKEIYNYFLSQHLDFDINNFELRSSVEISNVNSKSI